MTGQLIFQLGRKARWLSSARRWLLVAQPRNNRAGRTLQLAPFNSARTQNKHDGVLFFLARVYTRVLHHELAS